ncbi:hypothetical protein HPHPH29_0656 [Helicobacter pylori Hp H-29]|nr:hypothetical protein HPHPH29_0656 [Helicobacter pylori Hp H-29]
MSLEKAVIFSAFCNPINSSLVIGFIVVVVFNALWAINSEAFCSLAFLSFTFGLAR